MKYWMCKAVDLLNRVAMESLTEMVTEKGGPEEGLAWLASGKASPGTESSK